MQKNKKALRTEKINVVCVDYCFIPEMLLFFAVRVLSMCDRMFTKYSITANTQHRHLSKTHFKSGNKKVLTHKTPNTLLRNLYKFDYLCLLSRLKILKRHKI